MEKHGTILETYNWEGRSVKKAIIMILVFIVCCILTCWGAVQQAPIVVCLGAIASTILGSVVSIIFEAIDFHGQGLHLWLQHLGYWNKEVRLSISYLFRIEVDGKYLMVKGNRLKRQYQPVGGVYKYYPEAKPVLERMKFNLDTKMGNTDETDDLRIRIKGKYLLTFMEWFMSMENREYDPQREFKEELIDTGLLPAQSFEILKYRKVGVHNDGIKYSTYLACDELLYSDIFELVLTANQKHIIRDAVQRNPEMLCLASVEELRSQCCNGIEKNLGTNAAWIIGE